MIDRKILLGAAIAAGALMLVPGVTAAVARAARPAMRAAMKSGATTYDDLRRAGAEAYEHFEDVAAEVRAEMDGDGSANMPPAPGDASSAE